MSRESGRGKEGVPTISLDRKINVLVSGARHGDLLRYGVKNSLK